MRQGFETVTYMLAGRFRHKDNKGHEGVLGAGGAQWMTAGRGIVHSEMPEQQEGLVWGFQLWLNLPAAEKMREPTYRDLQPEDIPEAELAGGARARVLAGRIGDVVGPIGDRKTEPVIFDVTVPASGEARVPVPAEHEGFVYAFENDVAVGDPGAERALARGVLGVLDGGERRGEIRLRATGAAARVLVVAGRPLREPVVQYGPFVMNTMEELEQAVTDFRSGRF